MNVIRLLRRRLDGGCACITRTKGLPVIKSAAVACILAAANCWAGVSLLSHVEVPNPPGTVDGSAYNIEVSRDGLGTVTAQAQSVVAAGPFLNTFSTVASASATVTPGVQDLGIFGTYGILGLHALARAEANVQGGTSGISDANAMVSWQDVMRFHAPEGFTVPDSITLAWALTNPSITTSPGSATNGYLEASAGNTSIAEITKNGVIDPEYPQLPNGLGAPLHVFGGDGDYLVFASFSIYARAQSGQGSVEANLFNSAYLTGVFFPDGSTPESHGITLSFDSGLVSPNLAVATVPEPRSIAIFGLFSVAWPIASRLRRLSYSRR